MDIRKLQRAIVDGLEDVKAQDIKVFNTEHLSPLFERVIIASGTSNRQTRALASSVRQTVKARGMPVMSVEGEDNGEWIIVDCGAAVAHIMQPAIRDYYHLEEIWGGKAVRMKLDGGLRAVARVRPSAPEAELAGVDDVDDVDGIDGAAAPDVAVAAGARPTARTTSRTAGSAAAKGAGKPRADLREEARKPAGAKKAPIAKKALKKAPIAKRAPIAKKAAPASKAARDSKRGAARGSSGAAKGTKSLSIAASKPLASKTAPGRKAGAGKAVARKAPAGKAAARKPAAKAGARKH